MQPRREELNPWEKMRVNQDNSRQQRALCVTQCTLSSNWLFSLWAKEWKHFHVFCVLIWLSDCSLACAWPTKWPNCARFLKQLQSLMISSNYLGHLSRLKPPHSHCSAVTHKALQKWHAKKQAVLSNYNVASNSFSPSPVGFQKIAWVNL